METEYLLYKDEKIGELSIAEMSNRLNISIFKDNKFADNIFLLSSEDMEPEEMAKILLKGLTVCSYWMDADKLKEMIINHLRDF